MPGYQVELRVAVVDKTTGKAGPPIMPVSLRFSFTDFLGKFCERDQ